MNKPLDVLADELEESIDKYHTRLEMVTFMLTPKVCPKCKRLIVDQDSLIMMYHTGECPSCDHVEFE